MEPVNQSTGTVSEAVNRLLAVSEPQQNEAEGQQAAIAEGEEHQVEEIAGAGQDDGGEVADEGEAGAEQAEQELSTLDELIAKYSLDGEKVDGLKLKVKVSGEEKEVTLKDLKSATMFESDYRQKTAALAEARRQAEDQARAQTEELGKRMQDNALILHSLEEQMMGEYRKINWEELREVDPAEYVAKRQDFQDRKAGIDAQIAKLHQELDLQRQKVEQQQKEHLARTLSEERGKLLVAIPDWTDPHKSQTEGAEVGAYLGSFGYDSEEVSKIYDHRHVVLARKAMLYDKLMAKAKTSTQKLAEVPKVVKPGSKPGKEEIAKEVRMKKVTKLKKSGSVKDAAAAIFDLL